MAWVSGRTLQPASGELVFVIDENANLPAPQDWVQLWQVCSGIPPLLPGELAGYTDKAADLLLDFDRQTITLTRSTVLIVSESTYDAVAPGKAVDSDCRLTRRTVPVRVGGFSIPGTGECVLSTQSCVDGNCDEISIYARVRGTNPSRAQVSAALGNDILRAIAWRESTWRQFGVGGKPLVNNNSNGTADWGLMQINEATVEQRWNWRANVSRGAAILAEKRGHAQAYLSQHPPFTPEMLENEMIQRYNGGAYHRFNAATNAWEAAPPNGYVAIIRQLLATRPWGSRLTSRRRSNTIRDAVAESRV